MPAITPLAVPDESRTTDEGPNAIAAGSDGNLWFTEYSASKIGRMTPSGTTRYFPLPKGLRKPGGDSRRPRRRALVHGAEPAGGRADRDRRDPAAVPAAGKKLPKRNRAGPDHALWFAAGEEIGRIRPTARSNSSRFRKASGSTTWRRDRTERLVHRGRTWAGSGGSRRHRTRPPARRAASSAGRQRSPAPSTGTRSRPT